MMKKIWILLACICAAIILMPMERCEAEEISKPQVSISSYWLNDEKVVLGTDNSVHLEVTNLSSEYAVTDVMISFTSSNSTVVPVYGKTNQTYIATIEAQETVGVDLPINIVHQEDGYAIMSFLVEYCAGGMVLGNETSYIVIPVDVAEKFSIENISVSSAAQVNSKVALLVNYSNAGESVLQDIHMTITGTDIAQPIDLLVEDTLAVEEKGYFEYYLAFDKIGNKKISIELRYSDEDGNEYVMSGGEYSIQISAAEDIKNDENSINEDKEKDEQTNNNEPEVPVEDSIDVYLFIGIIVAIVIVCILIGVFLPKRHKK